MWGPAACTGLPMGASRSVPAFAASSMEAGGREGWSGNDDPLNAVALQEDPGSLTELGKIALIKYNAAAARYASNRLFQEGLSNLAELHEFISGVDKETVTSQAQALATASPAPLIATAVLSYIFSYAIDHFEVANEDQQSIERILRSQPHSPVDGSPFQAGLDDAVPPRLAPGRSPSFPPGCPGADARPRPMDTGCPVPGLAFPSGRPGGPRLGSVAVDFEFVYISRDISFKTKLVIESISRFVVADAAVMWAKEM